MQDPVGAGQEEQLSRGGGGGLGARGWWGLSEAGEPGGRQGVEGERARWGQESAPRTGSCGGVAAPARWGRAPPITVWWMGHAATWLSGHSREEGYKQEPEFGYFPLLPNDLGWGLLTSSGMEPFQCGRDGWGREPTMPAPHLRVVGAKAGGGEAGVWTQWG